MEDLVLWVSILVYLPTLNVSRPGCVHALVSMCGMAINVLSHQMVSL